jgi:hypothetical protein
MTFNLITVTSQTQSSFTLSVPSLSHALKVKNITQIFSLLHLSPVNSRGSSILSLLHLSPHKVKDLLTVIKPAVLVLLQCYMLPLSLSVNKAY